MKHLLLALTAFCGAVYASPVTHTAVSNATIQSGGDSGQPWFHNAQVPGGFESYAVSSFSFTASDFGLGMVSGLQSAEISYMQSNAFFTSEGPLEFFVSFDPTVGGGDYSGLAHNGVGSGLDDTQFSDSPSAQSLGTGTFTETATGDVDSYVLSFSGGTETALVNAINAGTPFSILLSAPSGSTAATYAGIENNAYVSNGGTQPDGNMTHLTLNAIPEADTVWLLLAGALGIAVHRLRRRRCPASLSQS